MNIYNEDENLRQKNKNKIQLVAINYIRRGFSPLPVKFRGKNPVNREWQKLRIAEADVGQWFPDGPMNIGVLLGEASDGLVDVDIDQNEATTFAIAFLPPTGMVFGREGSRSSHRIYRVPAPSKPICRTSGSLGTIVELRSNGQFTVFPGSIHETGEEISFESDGEPANSTWEELALGITKIAIATIFFKSWIPGQRHFLSLAAAGFLLNAGWQKEEIADLISVVAERAGDEEIEDRLTAIQTTFDSVRSGKAISASSSLVNLIGEGPVKDFEKWLGIKQGPKHSAIQNTSLDLATDSGCADAFADEYQGQLIYSDAQTQWYQRKNKVFVPTSTEILQGLVKSYLQQQATMGFQMQSSMRALLGRGRINAVIELSRSKFWADYEIFNCNRIIVGDADGNIINLDSATPLNTGTDEIVTKKLGAPFVQSANCPTWKSFLEAVFDGDHDVIDFLQRAIGYSLSGSVAEQVLFILVGTGANGKSTFLRTIMQLMGDYGTSLPMQTLMEQKHGGNQTNDLASLHGKRFVSASEGEASQKFAESKMKLMTGGDRIICRNLYKDFFEYDPQFKLWLATNNLPSVSGSDEAIWRRIRVIEFPVSIAPEKQDRELATKLSGELSGILNWATAGYQGWRKIGLAPPAQVLNATKSYRTENDEITQWIEARCDVGDGFTSSMKDLFASYMEWCENSGVQYKSDTNFGRELSRKKFEPVRRGAGMFRRGIALKDAPSQFSVVSQFTTRAANADHVSMH